MSAAVIIGKPCRLCPRQIPLSIADKLGSEEKGYVCFECLAKEKDDLRQLRGELEEFHEYSTAPSPPCAVCGTLEGDDRALVHIDSRMGLVCMDCEKAHLEKNREQFRNTQMEYEMKLR